MIYIGVDPGLRSGAVAAINHNKSVVFCSDIPQIDDRIDVLEFKKIILHAVQDDDFAICFEHVGVMPGQGISSSGRFMRAYGSIETVCRLMTINIVSVRPQVWKKEIGVTAEKETSLRVARLLFPDTDLSLKKHHNRAEALLIAEYARRNQ